MNKPNPIVLLMGGGSLFTVAGAIYGAKVPLWIKSAGAIACVLLGLTSIGLALHAAFFQKKGAAPKKYVPKRAAPVELGEAQRRAIDDGKKG